MWTTVGDTQSPHLATLLNYAYSHFARHIDWFLRHRDIGISTLATILTAESAIGGLYLSDKIKPEVAITILLMLTLLSVPLALLAVKACNRSFRAALEHSALVAKTMWAMGLTQGVPVSREVVHGKTPFEEDEWLYVPRYFQDALGFSSTEAYVVFQLGKRGTTFHAAKWTLRIMGVLAALLGTGTVIAITAKLLS